MRRQVSKPHQDPAEIPASVPPAHEEDAPSYMPTMAELAAIDRVSRRLSVAPPPKYRIERTATGVTNLKADHPDAHMTRLLLVDACASGSETFATGLLNQVVQVARTGPELKVDDLNFMLAAVRGINPRDETEALFAVQMAAIHNATMVAARRLNHAVTISQQDSASNMLNKLARTFAAQMETLKGYRSEKEQTIRVERVIVNDGGQAVVGTIATGGGASHETRHQPHEPDAAGRPATPGSPPLLGDVETNTMCLPGAGREGLGRVPLPRRRRRSSEG